MKIAITGGTGFVGSHLSNELVDRGHEVTAVSRNPQKTDFPIDDEVELRKGDVTDRDTLDFENHDVVVHLVALSPLFKPPVPYEKVHVEGTKNVIEACENQDVDELVHLSALGTSLDDDTEYGRTKAKAEKMVKESSLNWTVFRPSVIFGEGGEFIGFSKKLSTPIVTGLPGGGKTKFQPIWVGDVVDGVADSIEDREKYGGRTFDIAGPEILSLRKITEMAYQADGSKTRVLPVPMAFAKIGLSIAEHIDAAPMGKDQYRSLKNDNIITGKNDIQEFNKIITGKNDIQEFNKNTDKLKTIENYLGLS